MEFKQHYVVLLRKGPTWTDNQTPELDELQRRHQARLHAMHSAGMMALAGPPGTCFPRSGSCGGAVRGGNPARQRLGVKRR